MRKIVLLLAAMACACAQSANASRLSKSLPSESRVMAESATSGGGRLSLVRLPQIRFVLSGAATLERLLLNAYSILFPTADRTEWLD